MKPALISVQSPVAYLCAEFGLYAQLPLYAGGLGILAGDILKSAVEANFPMVGVGLLYKGRLAQQQINADDWPEDSDRSFDRIAEGIFPVVRDGEPLQVQVPLGSQTVNLAIYEKTMGKTVSLVLLEPDVPSNSAEMRRLTDILYCCGDESQLQQAILLGVGGYRALKALGLTPTFYHFNEGRPAFLTWEFQADWREQQHLSADQASQHARLQTVYTNHTLVAAGNQTYPLDLIKKYAQPFADRLGISADELIKPGLDKNATDRFSITQLALNSSIRASGVSQRHTQLAKQSWPDYHWDAITNGVHLKTWQKPEFAQPTNDDQELWNTHRKYKHRLMEMAVERTGIGYDPDHLIIAWARRITEYKQLDRVFADLERLEAILRHPARPIQILIAGKTHPGDDNAKRTLQNIIRLFQTRLNGVALYLPNYDIELAQYLTSGVDLWLNTPKFGLEASGTSGMKCVSNGVLQATVADGWSAEVDWTNRGWVLEPDSPEVSLYDQLENSIAPMFYQRDHRGLPMEWLARMRNSMKLANDFSAERVLNDYRRYLYHPTQTE